MTYPREAMQTETHGCSGLSKEGTARRSSPNCQDLSDDATSCSWWALVIDDLLWSIFEYLWPDFQYICRSSKVCHRWNAVAKVFLNERVAVAGPSWPYRSAQEAITCTNAPMIALTPGVYLGPLIITRPVTLFGVGDKDAIVIQSSPSSNNVICLAAPFAILRNVTVQTAPDDDGMGRPAKDSALCDNSVVSVMNGELSLDAVTIRSVWPGSCVKASGTKSHVSLRGCVLTHGSVAVFVTDGASAHVTSCQISRMVVGIFAGGASRVEVVGSWITETGQGVSLFGDSTGHVERSVIGGQGSFGVFVAGSRAFLTGCDISGCNVAKVYVTDTGTATVQDC